MKKIDKKFAVDRMSEDSWRMFRTMGEYAIGFDRMSRLSTPAVTVFGSARTEITNRYYELARQLGRALAISSINQSVNGRARVAWTLR